MSVMTTNETPASTVAEPEVFEEPVTVSTSGYRRNLTDIITR